MPSGPAPAGRGQPQVAPSSRPSPARVGLVLACFGGLTCGILMWLFRPHGVMIVVTFLGSVFLALAAGAAEQVIPVPREETRDEHPDQ